MGASVGVVAGLVALAGVCAAAVIALAFVAVPTLSGRAITTVRSRRRRLVVGCAWSTLLISVLGGIVVLVAAPAARPIGLALLCTPLVLVAACVVVVSLLLVRRFGRAAWLAALLGTAGLLLVCGVSGVNGPEPLPLPGLICLLWLPAPLIICGFVALHGLRAPAPMSVGRRIGAAVAAVAAGAALTGFAAQLVNNSGAYAVHYGTAATIGLPGHCTVVMFTGGSVPAHCSDVTWTDHAGNPASGTVYTDSRFWDRYGKYYSPGRTTVDPDDAAPPGIKITVFAVGDRAYMPGDTTTSARDAIGTPPLGRLAWAGLAVPAVAVVMLGGRMNRRRRVISRAERAAFGGVRPEPRFAVFGLAAAALLAGLGIAGVQTPDPWQLPGLVCLLLATAPLAAAVFIRLHRPRGPMTPRWRLVCGTASISAVAMATGLAAAVIVHNGTYTQRYGAAATMKLPGKCHPRTKPESEKAVDITECTHVTWTGPNGRRAHGTLHVSSRFWDEFGHYYWDSIIVDGVDIRSKERYFAAKVRVPVRVSGTDAYLAADRSIAVLGRPPLPWLSVAGALLAAALLAGYLGRPRRPHAATAATAGSAGAPPGRGTDARQRGRVRRVTETSSFIRVSVEASGLRVQRRTGTAASGDGPWRDHVNLAWDRIARMDFVDERHGPAILYVLTDTGTRLYALDRRQLTGAQWQNIAKAVNTATAGRIILHP